MEFSVLNRYKIGCFKTDKKHIVISITCPEDTHPDISKQDSCLGILKLKFHDWGEAEKERIRKLMVASPKATKQVFFTKEEAKKIVDFLYKHYGTIELIVCQCDAGISRSSAVAAAISKYITGSDEYFFKHYLPNSLVYKLLLEELYNGKVKV